jgi:hypothetical protein
MSASTGEPDALRAVADRLAIAQVLTLYSRGIDRCDLETLQGTFWPDATAQYGAEPQNAHAWGAATVAALAAMRRTFHSLSNMAIDLKGEAATAETYCTAYHEVDGPDGPVEMVVGGRYLDRLEKRDGAWRIARRLYVMDWNRNVPSTCRWDDGIYAALVNRGARKPHDPLYASKAD